MATPNYAGLLSIYESAHRENKGLDAAKQVIQESVRAKEIDCKSFDFGRFLAECIGWNDYHHCRSTGKLVTEVLEAAGPVTTASFQQISGQIMYGLSMDSYQSPEFIFSKAIPTRQTKFDFEKVAGIAEIGDEAQVVKEGDNYPVVGVSEKYRHAPLLRKRGFRIQLTREVVFFDRTGDLQNKISGGSKSMGQNREKRAVDCVIDENAGARSAILGGHRYHYLGNSIATYGNDSGNHNWDNLSAATGLVDWTDIEAVEILMDALTDPNTGEPIVFQGKHLVCTTQNKQTALRIRNATEISVYTPGFATTGNPTETKVGNPYANAYEVMCSPYVHNRLATDTDWYYGDLGMAFEYAQAWPEEVKQLAGGTQLEFDADIVQQYRWSEYGNYGTKEPRAMVRATA